MSNLYLSKILEYIGGENPMHYKKLKKTIPFNDAEFMQRAETFFSSYEGVLQRQGKDLSFALDSYMRFCNDMLVEQIKFMETGVYSSTSFDEVNKRVYDNPEVMEYHMHGLLMSQYLWEHHYRILKFFFQNIGQFSQGIAHVLEVGGGHGLYTNEILSHFNFDYSYTMVDISETSIQMAKSFVKGDKVNFIKEDIYNFTSGQKYDFIIMGEVLEHVEDPLGLMSKLCELGTDNATAFITVPYNSPSIDHIYLFRSWQQLKQLYFDAGWDVALDLVASSENNKPDAANDPNIPAMYAAFLKKRS
jgi:2-polyprenyl-3-methyl-5-hydroxy-6-metoxy-1,4-benzoquinol methylase